MSDALEATVHYAEKKQVQTYEELEREREDERRAEDVKLEDDDDEEEEIYNPWKIPLGWDGKPLPVWLYKLHGLNIEYKCEVRAHTLRLSELVVVRRDTLVSTPSPSVD